MLLHEPIFAPVRLRTEKYSKHVRVLVLVVEMENNLDDAIFRKGGISCEYFAFFVNFPSLSIVVIIHLLGNLDTLGSLVLKLS